MRRSCSVATERVRRGAVRLALIIACGLVFLWVGVVIWEPGNILWAKNAYGMARAGAWTGLDAFGATAAYWFFTLNGRTVLSSVMLLLEGFLVWFFCLR